MLDIISRSEATVLIEIVSRLEVLSEEAVVQYRGLVNCILNEDITDLMEIERINILMSRI